jgi:hypothetical protein
VKNTPTYATSPEADIVAPKERRIINAGEKLAAQLGVLFEVVPQKLADFRSREAGHPYNRITKCP